MNSQPITEEEMLAIEQQTEKLLALLRAIQDKPLGEYIHRLCEVRCRLEAYHYE